MTVRSRLGDYNFYQENAPPHRVIRGYPAKGRWPSSEHEEEDLLEADSSNKKARDVRSVGFCRLCPKVNLQMGSSPLSLSTFALCSSQGGSHLDCEAGAYQEDCLHWSEGLGCGGHQTLPRQHGTPRPLLARSGAYQSRNSPASTSRFAGKSRELVLHLGMEFHESMGGGQIFDSERGKIRERFRKDSGKIRESLTP